MDTTDETYCDYIAMLKSPAESSIRLSRIFFPLSPCPSPSSLGKATSFIC